MGIMDTSWKIPPFLQRVKALEEPVTTSTAKELMVHEPSNMEVMKTKESATPPVHQMSVAERTSLTNTIKAMSYDQLLVVMDAIPVELAFNRIGKELERDKQFRKAILQTMTILE